MLESPAVSGSFGLVIRPIVGDVGFIADDAITASSDNAGPFIIATQSAEIGEPAITAGFVAQEVDDNVINALTAAIYSDSGDQFVAPEAPAPPAVEADEAARPDSGVAESESSDAAGDWDAAIDPLTGTMEWDGKVKLSKGKGKIEVVLFGDENTNFTDDSSESIFFSSSDDATAGAQFMTKKGEFKVDIEDHNGDGFDDIEGEVKIKDLMAFGQATQGDDQIYAIFNSADNWMTFVDDTINSACVNQTLLKLLD